MFDQSTAMALFAGWQARFGDRPVTLPALLEAIISDQEFAQIFRQALPKLFRETPHLNERYLSAGLRRLELKTRLDARGDLLVFARNETWCLLPITHLLVDRPRATKVIPAAS